MFFFFCFVFFIWTARWFIKFEDKIRVFSIIEGYIQDSVFFYRYPKCTFRQHTHYTGEIWKRCTGFHSETQPGTQQLFFVHTTTEKFKNTTITGHFGVVLEENAEREIT